MIHSRENLISPEVPMYDQIDNKDELFEEVKHVQKESKPVEDSSSNKQPEKEKPKSSPRHAIVDPALVDQIDQFITPSSDDLIIKPDDEDILDETQIAMMYGQAPRENEPKTDITTPFKPPVVPEDDTVTLQNNENIKPKDEPKVKKHKVKKAPEIPREVEAELEHIHNQKEAKKDEQTEIEQIKINNENPEEPKDEPVVFDFEIHDEEIVSFKDKIPTDILDIDDMSYGPFNVDDVAVLPWRMVEVLLRRRVVDII